MFHMIPAQKFKENKRPMVFEPRLVSSLGVDSPPLGAPGYSLARESNRRRY